jgi:hypothetical protein
LLVGEHHFQFYFLQWPTSKRRGPPTTNRDLFVVDFVDVTSSAQTGSNPDIETERIAASFERPTGVKPPRLALTIATGGWAWRSWIICASVTFCLRSRVFELFLRPLFIGLRRAIGCRIKVALDAGFVGSILLALVITLFKSSSLGADQQCKGKGK